MYLALQNQDKILHHNVQIPHSEKIPSIKGSQPTNKSCNKIAGWKLKPVRRK